MLVGPSRPTCSSVCFASYSGQGEEGEQSNSYVLFPNNLLCFSFMWDHRVVSDLDLLRVVVSDVHVHKYCGCL